MDISKITNNYNDIERTQNISAANEERLKAAIVNNGIDTRTSTSTSINTNKNTNIQTTLGMTNDNVIARSSSNSRHQMFVTKTVFPGHPITHTTSNKYTTSNASNTPNTSSTTIQQPVDITYPKTEVVGHGSFGVVFVTTIQEIQEKVAIKKVLQDKRFKNRELEIMQKVQHVNIVDLKYYYYEEDPTSDSLYLNLILEFMPQSLYQRIRHYVHLQTTMPHDEVQIYMFQLFKGLNYIHGHLGICHRDIKPQNILINPENFQLKICDFGSAKRLNPMEPNVSYICSRYYRAPELIFGSTNYTTKIDIWSSACVMCELILGQPIFPGESGIDQLVEIIKILGTPNKQDIYSMNPNYMEHKFPHIKAIPLIKIFKREKDYLCIELIANMLKYNPFERFSALQCLCSSYFDKIRINFNDNIVKNLKLLEFNDDIDFNYLSTDEKLIVRQKLLPHLHSSINPTL